MIIVGRKTRINRIANTFSTFIRLIGFATLIALVTLLPAHSQQKDITIKVSELGSFGNFDTPESGTRLRYLGGWVLESSEPGFGGFSGLRVAAGGIRLFAISDRGKWLTARPSYDDKQRIAGFTEVKLGCICDKNGKPYRSKRWRDAEGLEVYAGQAFISFEGLSRINRYDLTIGHMLGRPNQQTPSFKPVRLSNNQGLEALARMPTALAKSQPAGNKFVAIAEKSLNANGHHRAFIASAHEILEFEIIRTDDFDVTDAAFLPDGRLLVLERRFGFPYGIGARIRIFDGKKIAPGASLVGKTLFSAGLTSQIDNMEGLAVYQHESGETRLVLLSDNNFSELQKTILLEFALEN